MFSEGGKFQIARGKVVVTVTSTDRNVTTVTYKVASMSSSKGPLLKHIALIDLGLGGGASRPRARARPSRQTTKIH